MRKFISIVAFFLICEKNYLQAQDSDKGTSFMFCMYEDNDFLNIRGNGTDNSYTNGLRFDIFYTKKKKSAFFIDRLMPKTGENSVNVFGWSLTQLMFTPNDISITAYQPNDYPYAGAIFVTHSLHSNNAHKKYSFRTELVAGIRGRASFAREFQTLIHSVINYDKPMGWDNQLRTAPLLNINFAVEKQLISIGHFIEVIGGAKLAVGSLFDATSLYPLVRIGKMASYFDGYLAQHGSYFRKGKKHMTQYYLILKPEHIIVLHNALVHGKRMNDGSDLLANKQSDRQIRHRLINVQFGVEVAHGNFGISYLQTHSTEFNKGLYRHNWGNISVFYKW